jgi:hypothetical protein
MMILAMEQEARGKTRKAMEPYLQEEASRLWELVQDQIIREVHLRHDRDQLVLLMDCRDDDEAKEHLSKLPLVEKGFITFELIPLKPYEAYSRSTSGAR